MNTEEQALINAAVPATCTYEGRGFGVGPLRPYLFVCEKNGFFKGFQVEGLTRALAEQQLQADYNAWQANGEPTSNMPSRCEFLTRNENGFVYRCTVDGRTKIFAIPSSTRQGADLLLDTELREWEADGAPYPNVVTTCFVGETLVSMADGTFQRIDSLQPGDEVLASGFGSKTQFTCPVSTIDRHIADDIVRATLSEGDDLTMSSDQPIFTEFGPIKAKYIEGQPRLQSAGDDEKTVDVVSLGAINKSSAPQIVYSLGLGGPLQFFVGKQKVAVTCFGQIKDERGAIL